MHQAIAFAIASEFCRKRPFARNFRNENKISAISFAKPFAFASEFLRNAYFAAFSLGLDGHNSLANFRGASEFAFAFAAVSRVHAKGVVLSERACFLPSKHLLSAFYNALPF